HPPTIATSAISPGVLAPASGPAGACTRESSDSPMPRIRITVRSFSILRRLAIINTCLAGLRNAASSASSSPLSLRRDQDHRGLARSVGEPDPEPFREEPRLVCGRRAPEHAQRAANAVRLNEQLDAAVARAGHCVVFDIVLGIDPVVADAHELRLAALDGALRGADDHA